MQLKQKLGVKYTVEGALVNMRNLKCKVFDTEIIVSELTRKQKDIADKLGILMTKSSGI